jgi:hypothetical protein
MMTGRSREAFLRFSERRRREDEARRLQEELPQLSTLRLEVEERRGNATFAETRHVRHIVVARAPSLFVLPCGDSDCRDGGHDVTDALMRQLHEGREDFVVEDACIGDVRGAKCDRVIRVHAMATYKA